MAKTAQKAEKVQKTERVKEKLPERPKVEKNISYRGKAAVAPVEGKIPYDPAVWQARDQGDYINTLTGEVRGEDGFDWDAKPGASGDGESTGGSEWDDYGQDSGGDFGGAQFKTGGKK